jgi:hypothetical protein
MKGAGSVDVGERPFDATTTWRGGAFFLKPAPAGDLEAGSHGSCVQESLDPSALRWGVREPTLIVRGRGRDGVHVRSPPKSSKANPSEHCVGPVVASRDGRGINEASFEPLRSSLGTRGNTESPNVACSATTHCAASAHSMSLPPQPSVLLSVLFYMSTWPWMEEAPSYGGWRRGTGQFLPASPSGG